MSVNETDNRSVIIARIKAIQYELESLGCRREPFNPHGSIEYLIDVGIATNDQLATRKRFLGSGGFSDKNSKNYAKNNK